MQHLFNDNEYDANDPEDPAVFVEDDILPRTPLKILAPEEWGNVVSYYDSDEEEALTHLNVNTYSYVPEPPKEVLRFTQSQFVSAELTRLIDTQLTKQLQYTCTCSSLSLDERPNFYAYLGTLKVENPVFDYERRGLDHIPEHRINMPFQGIHIVTRWQSTRVLADQEFAHIFMYHFRHNSGNPSLAFFVEHVFDALVAERGDTTKWTVGSGSVILHAERPGVRAIYLAPSTDSPINRLKLKHQYNVEFFGYEILPRMPELIAKCGSRVVMDKAVEYVILRREGYEHFEKVTGEDNSRTVLVKCCRVLIQETCSAEVINELVCGLCGDFDVRTHGDVLVESKDVRLIANTPLMSREIQRKRPVTFEQVCSVAFDLSGWGPASYVVKHVFKKPIVKGVGAKERHPYPPLVQAVSSSSHANPFRVPGPPGAMPPVYHRSVPVSSDPIMTEAYVTNFHNRMASGGGRSIGEVERYLEERETQADDPVFFPPPKPVPKPVGTDRPLSKDYLRSSIQSSPNSVASSMTSDRGNYSILNDLARHHLQTKSKPNGDPEVSLGQAIGLIIRDKYRHQPTGCTNSEIIAALHVHHFSVTKQDVNRCLHRYKDTNWKVISRDSYNYWFPPD